MEKVLCEQKDQKMLGTEQRGEQNFDVQGKRHQGGG